jgi:hypothetical protein
MCFSNAKYIGEIFPGHDLIKHDGFYKIVDDHNEIIRFPDTPLKDSFENLTDTQIDTMYRDEEACKKDDAFMHYVEEFRKVFRFHPQQGKQIVDLCIENGYDQEKDGWLEYWLINRAATMIDNYNFLHTKFNTT